MKWNSVRWWKKIVCTVLTREAKAGHKSLVPTQQAQRTNQRRTFFISTPWVPICLSFNSQRRPPPLSGLSLSLPNELKELGTILLPLLHPLLHGYDDCVGLVVRPVLRAFLRRSWSNQSFERTLPRGNLFLADKNIALGTIQVRFILLLLASFSGLSVIFILYHFALPNQLLKT